MFYSSSISRAKLQLYNAQETRMSFRMIPNVYRIYVMCCECCVTYICTYEFRFYRQTMRRCQCHHLAISSRCLNSKCKIVHLLFLVLCYAANVSSVSQKWQSRALMVMNPGMYLATTTMNIYIYIYVCG